MNPANRLKRIYLPHQERSRLTMDRILSTLAKVLESKPFEQITILELARRSRCAVTSIYARFQDKRALILALHERHRDEMILEIDKLLDPARWEGVDVEKFVQLALEELMAARKRRHNLLRAIMHLNDPEMFERAAQIVRHASERFSILLAPRLPQIGRAELEQRIDFAIRAVTATTQQREIFGKAEPARFKLSDHEFHVRLAQLFLAMLTEQPTPPEQPE